MDWMTGMQRAMEYLEAHLTEEISYEQVAKCAACSPFYFQKIFSILCGVPLGEYVRNRRLTLAGGEIVSTQEKIIDIALKYGYESPESFTRAFVRFHGVSPSEARRNGAQLRYFSPLSVTLTMKGGTFMEVKIVKKPAFMVMGKTEFHDVKDEENRNSIPAFWARCHKDKTVQKLLERAGEKSFLFGICFAPKQGEDRFAYTIAAEISPTEEIPAEFEAITIPARSWAVFSCVGAMPQAMQEKWHEICTEFFPTSGYRPTYEMDIEGYTAGDMSSAQYRSEIWIPIDMT